MPESPNDLAARRQILVYPSRVLIDVGNPAPSDIRLADIAYSLAHSTRYSGHCPLQPSIAAHSLAVEEIAGHLVSGLMAYAETQLRRGALMHDASEYLLGDTTKPVKYAMRGEGNAYMMSEYDALEAHVQAIICRKFVCSDAGWHDVIKRADELALAYEMAYKGWYSAAEPPDWVRNSLELRNIYRMTADGARLSFLARAEALGMTDAVLS